MKIKRNKHTTMNQVDNIGLPKIHKTKYTAELS